MELHWFQEVTLLSGRIPLTMEVVLPMLPGPSSFSTAIDVSSIPFNVMASPVPSTDTTGAASNVRSMLVICPP